MELLSRLGLSIGSSTISQATGNLSNEAEAAIRDLGQGLLALYAYDNLDIDFKPTVPTAEKPQDTLVHLTTGTMMPLHPDITPDDLNCSDELWEKYYRNPRLRRQDLPPIPIYDLYKIHSEQPHASNLTRRQRYQVYKYCADLVNYGPEYFRCFKSKLKEPEDIEKIPLTKSTQTPLKAVDISPSTVQGNAQALSSFFKQAGIGDAADDTNAKVKPKSPGNSAILVFGDLLTGQHIRSLLESRSVERTPWRRLQFIVYAMGLFHLKMACADALWRIFIQLKNSDKDPNSLMSFISQIHPKETRKFKSKPGFRRMHEIIDHVGKVLRLDELGNVASKIDPSHTSLDEFAKSEPTWESIQAMAQQIVRDSEVEIDELRAKDDGERDKQRENVLLMHKYFLLYEEISYAMNHGDIGRVEDCFTPWIWIFLGCGKLKYAAEMRRYLENVHFRYRSGLRCVPLLVMGKRLAEEH